jgi:hypothetical protein
VGGLDIFNIYATIAPESVDYFHTAKSGSKMGISLLYVEIINQTKKTGVL